MTAKKRIKKSDTTPLHVEQKAETITDYVPEVFSPKSVQSLREKVGRLPRELHGWVDERFFSSSADVCVVPSSIHNSPLMVGGGRAPGQVYVVVREVR